MSGRVVVAGGVAVDQSVLWEDLPGGAGVRFAHSRGWSVGGPAALAAVAASASGAATRCVAAVGTDPAGAVIRQRLARADVDVTTVVPLPGLTGRIVRPADAVSVPLIPPLHSEAAASLFAGVLDEVGDSRGEARDGSDQVLILPGASWGPDDVATEHALARCEPGDVLLIEWSSLEGTGSLVAAAYDLDVQIVALLAPYPLLPQSIDLPRVDVVVTDERGALHLADAGELPGSLCVSVAGGLAWDGVTYTAAGAELPIDAQRRHAILAGALAGRLACGDDHDEAAAAALAMVPASLAGGPWRHLALTQEDLA